MDEEECLFVLIVSLVFGSETRLEDRRIVELTIDVWEKREGIRREEAAHWKTLQHCCRSVREYQG